MIFHFCHSADAFLRVHSNKLNRTTIAFCTLNVKRHGVGRDGRVQKRFVCESLEFRKYFDKWRRVVCTSDNLNIPENIPSPTTVGFTVRFGNRTESSCRARSLVDRKTRSRGSFSPKPSERPTRFETRFNLGFQRTVVTERQTIADVTRYRFDYWVNVHAVRTIVNRKDITRKRFRD